MHACSAFIHNLVSVMSLIISAGGIDTRIRDLKISSTEERELGFDRDFFKGDNLIRYPILETYEPDQLYRRSLVLQRSVDHIHSNLCLSNHIKQDICLAFQTGGCLLLHESSAESSCRSFLRNFHSAISNHLSIAISMSPK